jgi:hypothetical protein
MHVPLQRKLGKVWHSTKLIASVDGRHHQDLSNFPIKLSITFYINPFANQKPLSKKSISYLCKKDFIF